MQYVLQDDRGKFTLIISDASDRWFVLNSDGRNGLPLLLLITAARVPGSDRSITRVNSGHDFVGTQMGIALSESRGIISHRIEADWNVADPLHASKRTQQQETHNYESSDEKQYILETTHFFSRHFFRLYAYRGSWHLVGTDGTPYKIVAAMKDPDRSNDINRPDRPLPPWQFQDRYLVIESHGNRYLTPKIRFWYDIATPDEIKERELSKTASA
jgi:hypothetical protein